VTFQVELAGGDLMFSGALPCRGAADYLGRHDPAEHAGIVERALEIGVFCLERTSTAQDVEFVRRQFDGLLSSVSAALGALPKTVEEALIARVGTNDGQVLAPVVRVVDASVKSAERGIEETRKLLQQVDPARSDGVLGQALQRVKDLLDPKRKDSVPGQIEEMVKSLSDADGAFSTRVTAIVDEALRPLKTDVRNLADRLLAEESAAAVINRTTEKGLPYEEEIVDRLRPFARSVGAAIEHVGADNQPGDIVLIFGPTSIAGRELKLVIEVRDRADGKGQRRVSDDLEAAIAYRGATAAVYLGRTVGAFAKEIGEFAEGRCKGGPFVAAVDQFLELAIRFIVVLARLEDLRNSHSEVDTVAIPTYVAQIRTSIDRTRAIKTKLTTINGAANDIAQQVDDLRSEVITALDSVESLLKRGTDDRVPATSKRCLVPTLAQVS
jgi:hypothetical protein